MDYLKLDDLFHPKSLAVIGASPAPDNSFLLNVIMEHGFKGQIYPVNPRGEDVMGLKGYRSVKDIPDPVDYAFIQVPAKATVDVMRDCGVKGVKLATLFTSGFRESESKDGNDLQEQLVSAARQGRVRLLGPNCMGIYNPRAGLAFGTPFPRDSGPVGAMCQSGGNAVQLVRAAAQCGIRFSKVISYGNAADINEADLMEYFLQDDETKVIIAYIEGVRDGRRFFQALRATAQTKPVILLQGGRNEAGAAAILSHTASLSSPGNVWEALLKQTGAVGANSIDECVDIALAFLRMKPPSGRKAAVIGLGGGAAVLAADDCHDVGLLLPPLDGKIRSDLKQFTRIEGNIFTNPIDASSHWGSPEKLARVVRVVDKWPEVDMLILYVGDGLGSRAMSDMNLLEPITEALTGAAKDATKPVAIAVYALYGDRAIQSSLKVQQMCVEAGIPFYHSVRQAASAISKVISYYHDRLTGTLPTSNLD